jgi:hypothetical protein
MGSLWSAPLGWALSCVVLLIPGYLLTKLIFPKKGLGIISSFISSLVLGTALTALSPTILGPYLKGFPSLYSRFILPGIWAVLVSFFLRGVAKKKIDLEWKGRWRGFRSRVLRALKVDSLTKLMFIAVPLFTFLYIGLNIFVINGVGWTASSYYIPVAKLIYSEDIIPVYDPYYNLGEPISKPPLPSVLYSTIFFQLSDTTYDSLDLFPILFGLGCTLCVYALSRTSLDRQTSVLSAIIFIATPIFMKCFSFPSLHSDDLFVLFFFSTTVYTYHLAQEGKSNRMAVVSGLSCCLAILSRAYCLFILPFTILLIHSFRYEKKGWQVIPVGLIAISVVVAGLLLRGGDLLMIALGALIIVTLFVVGSAAKVDVDNIWKRRKLSLIVLVLSSLGVFWYIRNFMLFGDPLYPYFGPLFHVGPLSDNYIKNLFDVVSNIYWSPIGESSHVGNLLNTVTVPLLSFDFGIFLFLFKILGLLTLLWKRNPLSNLLYSWMAVSYVTWLFLFNYSSNYLIQILPPLSIICAIGMMYVYGRIERIVKHPFEEGREPKIFVLTTVFSLFGYYILYYLDLNGLLPGILSSLFHEALLLKLPFLEGIVFSSLPFLILPFALFSSIIKARWGSSFNLRVDEGKKSLALMVLLVGLLLTFQFGIMSEGVVSTFKDGAISGIFSIEEAQELEEFIKREVPQEAILVSLTPETMRLIADHEVIYFSTPGGMYKMKDLLLMNDENAIIESLREREITYFIVPNPPNQTDGTNAMDYKSLKLQMIYDTYLFLAKNFTVFNLLQQEGGPFSEVFSNGPYDVYQLL